MRLGRFALIALVLAAAAALLLDGEAPRSGPAAPAPAAPARVSLYHYFSGTLAGGFAELVADLNRGQEEFRLDARALDHEAFKTMIHSAVAGRKPPELFAYWAGARVQNLVDRGDLAPIDDLWKKAGFDARFAPELVEAACLYNGRHYLLPLTQHAVVLFYDASRFAALGLEAPATWEAFTSACAALAAAGTTPIALGSRERWPAQFWFDYLLLRTAGPEYRDRLLRGKAAWTDPEVARACRLWTDLLRRGFFNSDAAQLDWAEATGKVRQGEAAMTLMGTWALPLLSTATARDPGRDFGFFLFPAIDAGVAQVTVGPVDGLVLATRGENRSAAEKALAFLADKPAQEKMSAGSGALAPSREVSVDSGSALHRRLRAAIAGSRWAFNYDLATPPAAAEAGLDAFAELIAFPDRAEAILAHTEAEMLAAFAKKTP